MTPVENLPLAEAIAAARSEIRDLFDLEREHARLFKTCSEIARRLEAKGVEVVHADRDPDGFTATYRPWIHDGEAVLCQGAARPGEGEVSPEGEEAHVASVKLRTVMLRLGVAQTCVKTAMGHVEKALREEALAESWDPETCTHTESRSGANGDGSKEWASRYHECGREVTTAAVIRFCARACGHTGDCKEREK